MRIIKLNAIGSTNTYLKQLLRQRPLEDFTVVVTKDQFEGRGQRENSWQTEPNKNLTFSILCNSLNFEASAQFKLNMIVSVAVYEIITAFDIPKLSLKWPNDILSHNQKIGGILIENYVKNKKISNSIIGIGLNVNQTSFSNLQKASSLKIITGQQYDLDNIMFGLINNLKERLTHWKSVEKELEINYESLLYRINKPSTFEDQSSNKFVAFIRGVTDSGKLILELEGNTVKHYNSKEIRMLF